MSDTPLDDRFARFAATGDEALRSELVLEHQGLAIAFARRYARTGRDNDLEQIALEALIHAINRFDPEREVPFRPTPLESSMAGSSSTSATMVGTSGFPGRSNSWRSPSARRPAS